VCRLLEDGLAEERSEGRQPGERETAEGEDRPGVGEVASRAPQVRLVESDAPVLENPYTNEERCLYQAVADHVHGGSGQAIRREEADTGQKEAHVAHRGEG
jgi:hypothetical protein